MENQGESGTKCAIVSASELGTNCWLPRRFIKGRRCCQVIECNYPEKKTCMAVQAEIEYLGQHIIEIQTRALAQMGKAGQEIAELMKLQKG